MSQQTTPSLVLRLSCSDVAASRQFYTDILGFDLKHGRPQSSFVHLSRNGVEIMLEPVSGNRTLPTDAKPPFGRGLQLQVKVDNLNGLYTQCLSYKVALAQSIEEVWYPGGDLYTGQQEFAVADPDGYVLRFVQKIGSRVAPPSTGRVCK